MKYLKNNDIVIILVIFLLFCLYLFKDKIEGFQNTTSMVDPILKKKQDRKNLLFGLIKNVEFSINKIQNINTISKKIIKILFENNYDYKQIYAGADESGLQAELHNLYKNIYLNLSDIEINDDVDKKDLLDLVNKFKEINNDVLFKHYIELFEKVNNSATDKNIYICSDTNNGIVFKPQDTIFNFFTNLKNYSNIIASSNPLSVNLIEQNIKQIISQLSLVNLKKNTRDETYGLLNEYTELLQIVFNNRLNFDIIFILQQILDCNPNTKKDLIRNHDDYNQHLNYIDFQLSNIKGTLTNVLDFFEGEVSDIFIEDDEQNFFEISRNQKKII